ncbi:MAG: hypothetical protein K0Q79_2771 [Flavipsychrobacter sp.]|jgi:hypothetical protein|nr:hypothetical protein [Flavipsychrobacter sp.]
MKRCIYLLLVLLCINAGSQAAVGDTTWVGANNTQMPWFGSYDSTVVFPAQGKSYRAIYMIFTLGKYVCPGTPTYCGDWDYTVLNYLITPGGQSYELGRLITPYANAGAPRTPWGWQQRYVYDVTDYAPLLHDTAKIRIFYSGYSGGFTGNIRFAFIEGAPDREVTGIRRLWSGSFGYGGTPGINAHFPMVNETAPQNTKSADLKFLVTGHGSDANYCCEFMPHDYMVSLNGSQVARQTIWRDDCGMNELYPQSGTWIYDRANWCPGASVNWYTHNLPGIKANTNFNLQLQFEPYSGGGSYTTEAILFYYGSLKKILDASIDDIIAPTNDQNHFRQNPICGSPVVHIKNRGANTIDSVTIRYGIKDSAMVTYTWKGKLKTFEESDITLPILKDLDRIAGDTVTRTFIAKIIAVNGTYDADSTNNLATSRFLSAPKWPSKFRIAFRTNNDPIATGSGISESSWYIYDAAGNVVKKRDNASLNTIYNDTASLRTGFYRLQLYDSSCTGLQWWANAGGGAGYFTVRNYSTNVTIPMKGYYYAGSGTYNNDFGCGFTQYFYVLDTATLGITNVAEVSAGIEAYPNPAQNNVYVELSGLDNINGQIHIIDALGRVVSVTNCTTARQLVETQQLANGLYTILFIDEADAKLTTRLLIAK